MFLCTCRMQLWPPCRKFLVKTLRTFCWSYGIDEKFTSFPKGLFLEMFVWTCELKLWQACCNIVGKKSKNSPKFQTRWMYNFLNKSVFFNKNDSLTKGNAISTILPKKFLQKLTKLPLRFQKRRKKNEFFERKINFLKMFLCTCKMQLWPRCRKLLVKTLKTFCWSSRIVEKFISFPKNHSLKCSSELAQGNFREPAVTLSARIRKFFQNSKIVEVTFFWTKMFFSSKIIL